VAAPPIRVAELTSLDVHLAGYIGRAVRDFALADKSIPPGLTADEWQQRLVDIADGFELYASVDGRIDAPDLQGAATSASSAPKRCGTSPGRRATSSPLTYWWSSSPYRTSGSGPRLPRLGGRSDRVGHSRCRLLHDWS
jgi:hypothetical protein